MCISRRENEANKTLYIMERDRSPLKESVSHFISGAGAWKTPKGR